MRSSALSALPFQNVLLGGQAIWPLYPGLPDVSRCGGAQSRPAAIAAPGPRASRTHHLQFTRERASLLPVGVSPRHPATLVPHSPIPQHPHHTMCSLHCPRRMSFLADDQSVSGTLRFGPKASRTPLTSPPHSHFRQPYSPFPHPTFAARTRMEGWIGRLEALQRSVSGLGVALQGFRHDSHCRGDKNLGVPG